MSTAQQPIFNIKRPDSFEDGNPIINSMPLIKNNNGKYLSHYDFHNVSSKDAHGVLFLNKFKDILNNENIYNDNIQSW